SPPVEEGDETKAIPVITEEQLGTPTESDETIVHKVGEDTKAVNEKKPKKKMSRRKRWLIFIILLLTVIIGSFISLFVWPGFLKAKDVTIIDVIDMPYEEAVEELEQLFLKTAKETVFSDEIDEDHVVKTNPKAGRTVKENSVVTLFVSEGKEMVTFGDYVGKEYEQTKRLLESEGFENIRSKESFSDKSVGEIIAHIEPEAGSEVVPSEVEVVLDRKSVV